MDRYSLLLTSFLFLLFEKFSAKVGKSFKCALCFEMDFWRVKVFYGFWLSF
jgi:hypothetical protein